MRKATPQYTRRRKSGYWWWIKKGTKNVGYISIGSKPPGAKGKFYAFHLDPLTLVGHGYRTVQDAFNAYAEKFPLNE